MSEPSSIPSTSETDRPRPRGRHFVNSPLRSHRKRWISIACVAMLVVVMGAGGFMFLRLRSNVATEALNLGDSANLQSGPLDILVIGSDTRSGANANYGDSADQNSGARSDVMMLVQISEDRSNVNVVSFPRDLMGTIPKCTDAKTGEVYPEEDNVQINQSLGHGGPGCTVATISQMTGMDIDHFMLVDFNAVKELSSVVGGVQVCVNKAIDDEYSGLNIPAGHSDVEGEQALAFLRSRHGFGDGSDTGRIKAQQAFLSSLIRKMKSEGSLSNPSKLYDMAEAITQNVTVDNGFTNVGTLASVGSILASVDLSKIVFATVPTEPYVNDANKLQLSEQADQVFAKLQADGSLTDTSTPPSPSADSSPSGSSTATSTPVDRSIPISLLNASGQSDAGTDGEKKVKELGYAQVSAQDLGETYTGSTVYYSAGYESQAREIAAKLGISSDRVQENQNYLGVAAILGQSKAAPEDSSAGSGIVGGATGQTADQQTCQQAYEY